MSTRANAHIKSTRVKKLQTKAHLQIVREDQVEDLLDLDLVKGLDSAGVDASEAQEYHLQQAVKAASARKQDAQVKDGFIPTPPTIASEVKYDVLFEKSFGPPATYIRSSATVEDAAGIPYCMDEDDDLALKLINKNLPDSQSPISEDDFEEVMNFFEETATSRQPFAAVDSPPVLPLEELQDQFDDTHSEHIRVLAKFVYEHWASRRTENGNRLLPPHLKFETGAETDDADPYVCFRRRELRQIRTRRNRDAQSAEKLRKLRLELETARQILTMVKRREMVRKESLEIDKQVFEQRMAFRETKRKLGIKGDEELLVNVKRQKLPPGVSPNQAALAHQMRLPMSGGAGTELRALADVQDERRRSIENEIQTNVDKHKRWNEGFVDNTKAPLTPDAEVDFDQPGQFRNAMPATYLPTPPASHSDEEGIAPTGGDVEMKDVSRASTPFRYASPIEDEDMAMPAFRRRYGRGGRVLFDRKFPKRVFRERDPEDDRWKYDSDNDENDRDVPETFEDRSAARMMSRAYLFGTSKQDGGAAQAAQRKAQIETGHSSNNHSTANVVTHQQVAAA